MRNERQPRGCGLGSTEPWHEIGEFEVVHGVVERGCAAGEKDAYARRVRPLAARHQDGNGAIVDLADLAGIDDDVTTSVEQRRQQCEAKCREVGLAEAAAELDELAVAVPDDQLQKELADKLRYDRVGYGNVFNALALNVQNGVVTISGDVRDYPARDSAIAIAETTLGV